MSCHSRSRITYQSHVTAEAPPLLATTHPLPFVGFDVLYLSNDAVAAENGTENDVVAIQMPRGHRSDEKLAACGACSGGMS